MKHQQTVWKHLLIDAVCGQVQFCDLGDWEEDGYDSWLQAYQADSCKICQEKRKLSRGLKAFGMHSYEYQGRKEIYWDEQDIDDTCGDEVCANLFRLYYSKGPEYGKRRTSFRKFFGNSVYSIPIELRLNALLTHCLHEMAINEGRLRKTLAEGADIFFGEIAILAQRPLLTAASSIGEEHGNEKSAD